MAVVSGQNALASAVAVMAAVVAVAATQPKAALAVRPDLTCEESVLANALVSHVRMDARKAVQKAEPLSAASARMPSAANAATHHAPMACAQNARTAPSAPQVKYVSRVNHASHVKVAAPSARAANVVSAPSVAASAHRATQLSKKWRWPTRLPWQLQVVTQAHQPKTARSKMVVKAVPAVAVAAMTAVASAVMKAPQHL